MKAKKNFYEDTIINSENQKAKNMWQVSGSILPSKSVSERIPDELDADTFNIFYSETGKQLID